MRCRGLAGLLVILLGACGGAQHGDQLPSFVRVTLLNATIGPGKVDGTQWDGLGRVPQEVSDGLGAALDGAEPFVAVLRVLGALCAPLEKPEAFGWAEVYEGTAFGRRVALPREARDTFTPAWAGPPSWAHVALDDSVRIRLHLIDEDVAFNDPIGDVELARDDLVAALRSGHVHQIAVDDQTQRQVLFVGISVVAESDTPTTTNAH